MVSVSTYKAGPLLPVLSEVITPFGGFLKWWYPTTMGFPTKNDHFGVFWWYHHLRKPPFTLFVLRPFTGGLTLLITIVVGPTLYIYPLKLPSFVGRRQRPIEWTWTRWYFRQNISSTASGTWMSHWKLGSMVSKWVISPTYNWGILGL